MERNTNIFVGKLGKSVKSRYFSLEEFDPDLASGYARLVKTDKSVGIRVLDTYGNDTKEEEEKYLSEGYIHF